MLEQIRRQRRSRVRRTRHARRETQRIFLCQTWFVSSSSSSPSSSFSSPSVASPSKDRLPSTYARAPFCHTCQTNQTLLVNLLSNYLPPPQASFLAARPFVTTSTSSLLLQHPDYPMRLEQLPMYRESLHIRYPPVCANCLPAVEDQIEQKNHMARTKALAGWLKQSKGKERQRLLSGPGNGTERLQFQLAIWRVRGALWCTTLFCVVVAHGAGRCYRYIHRIRFISLVSDSRL